MKIKVIAVVVLVALILAAVLMRKDTNTYENGALGVRFEYPDTYKLESRELGEGKKGHLSLILLDKAFVPVEGGEGPPVISLDFYQSPSESSIREWVETNALASLHQDKSVIQEGTVDGKPALIYPTDGLYAGDSAVVANRDYFLVISGQYMDSGDQIRKDFQDVLKSLELF